MEGQNQSDSIMLELESTWYLYWGLLKSEFSHSTHYVKKWHWCILILCSKYQSISSIHPSISFISTSALRVAELLRPIQLLYTDWKCWIEFTLFWLYSPCVLKYTDLYVFHLYFSFNSTFWEKNIKSKEKGCKSKCDFVTFSLSVSAWLCRWSRKRMVISMDLESVL